ncbi:MAG TPA: hypothetical protein VIS95_04235 [Solirubrobacterales bacterium]
MERLSAAVEAAIEGEDGWEARLSAGLRAGLELLAADPPLARLLLVDSLASSGADRLRHERSLARLADALRPPAELTGGELVSDEVLRLQAGGLASYLSGRVLAGEAQALPGAHPALFRYLLAFSAPRD